MFVLKYKIYLTIEFVRVLLPVVPQEIPMT
jgi:hypothetical protein